ncbi:MAG: prohibitin family protein [Chloroflexi bacterium]|nr:MAG: prohibitin family protein [Chloroflexota bacterium]
MLNLLVVLAGLVVLIASGIFGIFFPLSRGATVGGVRQVPPPKVHIVRGLVGGAIGGVIMVIGFAGPFVTNFGQVQTVTLEPGLHFVIPIYQRVTNVDTRVQPHEFQEIDAASRELQTVKLTGVMNYHIDGQFASDLFQRVGTDFAAKIIDPAFNDFIKTVVPDYSVNDILAKRDEIRSLAKAQLAGNLQQYHIIVDDIYIANIAFSDAFQQAIEAKQVAQQQVQTEQQILAQKQIQAQQAVAAAKGQADATVTLAEGQSKANGLLNASLTDQILQYQYIQKLTDKITVMLLPSGNQTIFDLKSLLGQTGQSGQ